MFRYQDPGVEAVMRESGERFEEILREIRTWRSARRKRDASLREELEENRALRRELHARLERLDKRDPKA